MSHKRKAKAKGKKRKGGKWIQSATAEMKRKGTLGSFGKATPGKIAAAKRKGGKMKKKAVFAQNMRKLAQKRKHKRAHKR